MTRGDEPGSGSPVFCEHANEVPTSFCVCPPWCYCQTRTCKLRDAYLSKPDPSECSDVEFDAHVAATERTEDGRLGGLDYCLLKLSSEAGEVGQIRAREILAGRDPMIPYTVAERAAYALELGDEHWYFVEACRILGLTVGQVKRLNIMKLRRRRETFPGGGLKHGKDPEGEQREAENMLDPSPIKTQAAHSFAPKPNDGYGDCADCGDVTRHKSGLQSIWGPGLYLCVPCGGAR